MKLTVHGPTRNFPGVQKRVTTRNWHLTLAGELSSLPWCQNRVQKFRLEITAHVTNVITMSTHMKLRSRVWFICGGRMEESQCNCHHCLSMNDPVFISLKELSVSGKYTPSCRTKKHATLPLGKALSIYHGRAGFLAPQKCLCNFNSYRGGYTALCSIVQGWNHPN